MSDFRKSLFQLSQNMAETTEPAALFTLTARALADLGCDDFTFAGSNAVRLGQQAFDLGVTLYFTTLSPERLRATEGSAAGGYSIYMRRFLLHGLESFFADPSVYTDARPAELDHVAAMHQAGYRRGFFGVLSRIPGHFTGTCYHLDGLSDSELNRHSTEICEKVLAVGKLMDSVFLAKFVMAKYGLTPQECDILSRLAGGLRPDQIADSLGMGTVDKYILNATKKLSARTQDDAVARALMLGLLEI